MTDFDKNELQKRIFKFAVNIILLIRKLPKGNEYQIISYQLIKSSTSSGANLFGINNYRYEHTTTA